MQTRFLLHSGSETKTKSFAATKPYFPFFGCARFRDLWQFVIKVRSGGGGGSHVNQGGRTLAHPLTGPVLTSFTVAQPFSHFSLSQKRWEATPLMGHAARLNQNRVGRHRLSEVRFFNAKSPRPAPYIKANGRLSPVRDVF